MKIAKCTPAIGAELLDLDMSFPLSPAIINDIHAALMQSLVIFIRDTSLTPAAHLEFAGAFGQLEFAGMRRLMDKLDPSYRD